MKKSLIFLILTVTSLFCFLPLTFAANTDVSGEWKIVNTYPDKIIATGSCIAYCPGGSNGSDKYQYELEIPYKTVMMPISQQSDGTVSGTFASTFDGSNITIEINGKVTENAVTFHTLRLLENPDYFMKITEDYSGTVSGSVITGAFTGSETDVHKTDDCSPPGMTCPCEDTGYAFFNGTFKADVYKGPARDIPADNGFGDVSKRDPRNEVGDPINSVTGNMYEIVSDLNFPGRGLNFDFTRTFNSLDTYNGPMGRGWTHSYNLYLILNPPDAPAGKKYIKVKDEESRGYFFMQNENGSFTAQRGEYSKLTKNSSSYIWTKKDGKQHIFNLSGKLTQIKDRYGNTVSLNYDSTGRLVKITDTVGRQVNFSYDTTNRITRLTGPASRVIDYSYDTKGNLIKVKDPVSNYLSYTYDTNNRMVRKTDKKGYNVYFTYDAEGRCTSSIGENNIGKTELKFDPVNKKTEIRNSKGNTSTHYYNEDNLIIKVKDAQSVETLTEWNSSFNMLSHTDGLDRKTKMFYDARGNLIKLTDPLNNSTYFTYEPNFNLVTSSTDATGYTTTYAYDTKGNLLKLTDALGYITTSTYNAYGQALTTTNPLSKITYFTYDAQGNLATTRNALGFITTYSYDATGNPLQIKDPRGSITKFTYDVLNQLTKVTYADNSIVSYAYDANGNKTSVTDQLGAVTASVYDEDDRLKSVTDALGYTVTNEYDTEGNITVVIDQNNNKTTYEYDSLNRLIRQADALGNTTSHQYDAVGNKISSTDAKGKTIAYAYDEVNHLTSLRGSEAAEAISYTYDKLGRRASMADSFGTTTYTYDKLGRLLTVDGPGSKDTLTYTYDKAGNRLTVTDPDAKTIKYGYDALNRLTSITDPQSKITKYAYDAVNNLTSTTLPNGTSSSYTYDALNRLLKLANQKGSTKLSEFAYTYDKAGRRIKSLRGSAAGASEAISYAYDNLGQLTEEKGVTCTFAYTYDPAGNRLKMLKNAEEHTYEYNALNQLTKEVVRGMGASLYKNITVTGTVTDPSGVKSVSVNEKVAILTGNNFTCSDVKLNLGKNTITVKAQDKVGNNSSKAVSVTYDPYSGTTPEEIRYLYDENGNLIRKQKGTDTVNLNYDWHDQLTKIAGAGVDSTYAYDGDGRRILSKEGTVITKYLYDGQSPIIERNATDSTTASYVRNPLAAGGIGGIISSTAGTQQNYYHYDGLGSVVNLTSTTGATTKSQSYDAFGNVVAQSGSASTRNQFLTKETGAIGLVYFGARYYDPAIGRFITPDPSGMADGPNLYLYCLNDPVNAVDLWGLRKQTEINKQNNNLPAWALVIGGITKSTPIPYDDAVYYAGIATAGVYIAYHASRGPGPESYPGASKGKTTKQYKTPPVIQANPNPIPPTPPNKWKKLLEDVAELLSQIFGI